MVRAIFPGKFWGRRLLVGTYRKIAAQCQGILPLSFNRDKTFPFYVHWRHAGADHRCGILFTKLFMEPLTFYMELVGTYRVLALLGEVPRGYAL